MTAVTAADVIREVRRLAAEHPDAVYWGDSSVCYYTRGTAGDGCGCGVGQALVAAGVLADLKHPGERS